VAGALGGAAAALLAIWLLGGHPGRVTADVDAVRAEVLALGELEAVRAAAVDARLDVLMARLTGAAQSGSAEELRQAIEQTNDSLRALRDAVRFELAAVDVHVHRMREALDVPATEPAAIGGPLDERDESRWVVLASDPDPGVRFSSLALLGRRKSDRSVAASRAALGDEEPMVTWQALRNVAAFGDRQAAPDVAALLVHDQAVVRAAAHDALVRVGAPADTAYDPVGTESANADAVARLSEWARSAR